MKVLIQIVFSLFMVLLPTLFSGCTKEKASSEDLSLSQLDIDLLIQHKDKIDSITKKYDEILTKTKAQNRSEVIEKGKSEINRYLKSKKLNPELFMRKSKKILKGYIAFYTTGEKALERRRKALKEKNLSQKEIETNIKAFQREKEKVFKEMTSSLTDYEIELVRTNLQKISTVVKL